MDFRTSAAVYKPYFLSRVHQVECRVQRKTFSIGSHRFLRYLILLLRTWPFLTSYHFPIIFVPHLSLLLFLVDREDTRWFKVPTLVTFRERERELLMRLTIEPTRIFSRSGSSTVDDDAQQQVTNHKDHNKCSFLLRCLKATVCFIEQL